MIEYFALGGTCCEVCRQRVFRIQTCEACGLRACCACLQAADEPHPCGWLRWQSAQRAAAAAQTVLPDPDQLELPHVVG